MNLDETLAALESATGYRPRPSGTGYQARCPAHDDSHPSLNLTRGNNGRVLFHCFAGCTYEEIISHLNIDICQSNGQRKSGSKWDIAATYDYTDANGKLIFQVVRFTPKKFRPRRPDPDKPGEWLWNLTRVSRVLYRLPEIIEAKKHGKTIWVVEGEKDADRLIKEGLCATTRAGGAKAKWLRSFSDVLRGAEVAVIPDNDAPGIATARVICNELTGVCADVRLVKLPDLAPKEDVSNFLDKHQKTVEDLKALYDAAPVWTPVDADDGKSDAITSDRKIENELTELGTARLLKEYFGENLRHDSGLGWLAWDEKRWKRSEKAAKRYVHKLGDIIRKMAAGTEDPILAGKIYKHAKAIEKAQGARTILEQAQSLVGIDADAIEFDNHPLLLVCPNGVIDLRSGKLLEHSRDLYITKLCPINYNPDARCPRYVQTLNEVFLGDEELIDYWQWIMGYALTGGTTHQCFFILYGSGSNGKTTLLVVFKKVLGPDFSCEINPEALLNNRGGYSSEIASLRGLRFVTCMETGQSRRLNEALIKALTGGDALQARYLYQNPFEFTPQLKLFFGTNHRPTIRDDSLGMWRRVRLIPFMARFEGEDCDKDIAEKLRVEAEGILAWAVRGAMRAADGEPPLPDVVKAATKNYQAEEDSLQQFLDEECEFYEFAWVSKKHFYRAYHGFMNGKCETKIEFGKRLIDRGIEEKRHTDGTKGWKGITLVNKEVFEEPDQN